MNQTTFSPDSEIQIDCQTNGSQRTLWYKDGALLHTNEGVLVFANGTLLIKRALPIDSGTYMCEAANYYNTATASVTIEVLGKNSRNDVRAVHSVVKRETRRQRQNIGRFIEF